MEDVALVAGWAAFGLVWWWLNRLGKKREWKWWQRHPLGLFAGFIVLAIVGAAFLPVEVDLPAKESTAIADKAEPGKPVEVEATTTPDQAQLSKAKPAAATLGLMPDEYLQRFNERLAVTDLGLRGQLQMRAEGSVNDTQTIAISDLHAVVLAIDRQTGQLISVTYMGQGDGSASSGGNVMVVAITAMVAAAKNETSKSISAAVLDLIASREDEEWISRVVGTVELGHQSSDLMGAVFSVAQRPVPAN